MRNNPRFHIIFVGEPRKALSLRAKRSNLIAISLIFSLGIASSLALLAMTLNTLKGTKLT